MEKLKWISGIISYSLPVQRSAHISLPLFLVRSLYRQTDNSDFQNGSGNGKYNYLSTVYVAISLSLFAE